MVILYMLTGLQKMVRAMTMARPRAVRAITPMNVKYTIDPRYAAYRTAYAFRKPLSKAAVSAGKRIWRAWSNRKAKRARMAPSAPSVCKSVQDVPGTQPVNMTIETLYRDLVIAPSQPSSANEYNVRDKAVVYYKGFHICRMFVNNNASVWLEVHYAIVQWRKDAYDPSNVNLKEDFFRDTSAVAGGNKRTSDFEDVVGTRLFDFKYSCLKMNPNKKYRIITHKRFILSPRQTTSGDRKYARKIDMYLPVKKRMNFATRDAIQPDAPFEEIYWYTARSAVDWDTIANPGGFAQVETYNVNRVYFKG